MRLARAITKGSSGLSVRIMRGGGGLPTSCDANGSPLTVRMSGPRSQGLMRQSGDAGNVSEIPR